MGESFYTRTTEAPSSAFDLSLRPPAFSEFCGQEKIKDRLMLMVEAARQRDDVLDHILLSGPPGLGKTTLANIIANAVGCRIHTTSGPQIEKAGDLAGVLTNLEKGDILFIDEIHRLHPAIEEYLYPAMEDFRLDIIIDQGPNARSIQLNLPKFTLVGATTRAGMLTSPLRSRFGLVNRLDYYTREELCAIIERSAGLLNVPVDPEGALQIALRSRGTPRVANSLLRWVRDYAQVRGDGVITEQLAHDALTMIEIDDDGLDEMDKRLLEAMIYKFNGGPGGPFLPGGGRRGGRFHAGGRARAFPDYAGVHQPHPQRARGDALRLSQDGSRAARQRPGVAVVSHSFTTWKESCVLCWSSGPLSFRLFPHKTSGRFLFIIRPKLWPHILIFPLKDCPSRLSVRVPMFRNAA